jgi:hypothetical protein
VTESDGRPTAGRLGDGKDTDAPKDGTPGKDGVAGSEGTVTERLGRPTLGRLGDGMDGVVHLDILADPH